MRQNTIELRTRSDQAIEAFLLPKWAMRTQKEIGLMSCKSFQRTQPFGGKHVWSCQKMDVIRHYDERMELVPVQFAVSVPQRRHYHLCNFRAPEEQRTSGAGVQEPVDGYERFAGGDESGWREYTVAGQAAVQTERDEEGLIDYVPVGEATLIVPHTSSWCFGGGETLAALSRLKAGCGQYCPPSNLYSKVAGVDVSGIGAS